MASLLCRFCLAWIFALTLACLACGAQNTTVYGGQVINATLTDSAVLCNRSQAQTVYLPANAAQGKSIVVIDASANAATYNITVLASQGTVNATSSYVLSTNNSFATFTWSGNNWRVGAISVASSGGGSGTPGGNPGQVQYNNAGSFGGLTVSGDGTLATSTGALTVTKTNGSSFAASATTDTTTASNITSGTLPAAQLPNPTASTLGGVQSLASVASKWINTISTSGVPAATQPGVADVTGAAASGTNVDITSLKLKSKFASTNYTITTADYFVVTSGAGVTLTLPTNVGAAQNGRIYVIWNSQGTANTLSDPGGSITLAGTGTYSYGASITLQASTVYFVYADNGTSWYALAQATGGSNPNITSINGLTTPLSVAQGGSGAATLTANALLAGNGTSAITTATSGSSTLVNGTVTVTCSPCTTTSIIDIIDTGSGAATSLGSLAVKTKNTGSFVVNSSLATDTSTLDWFLVKP